MAPFLAGPNISPKLPQTPGCTQAALERLTPLVYAELRRMAGRYMQRENQGNSLQATALVC